MTRQILSRLLAASVLFALAVPALAQFALPRPQRAPTLGTAAGSAPAPTGLRDLDRVVAVVNNDVITASELEARSRSVERQLRRQNIETPPADVLRSQVLERMIVDRAQVQLARESGMRIEDSQLERAIARIADENRVSISQLRDRVEADGLSFAKFRDELRNEMLMGRLREREVEGRIQISEADIDAFLAEQGSAPDGATEYNAAQILLRLPEGASPEQIERQRQRADELAKQAVRGTDFSRLAASFSDAPDAMSGGALGWRPADRLPEIFVQALSKLKPNEVAVVRSPNGFHVLKLLERRDAGVVKLGGEPIRQTRARHILIRPSEIVSEAEALRRLRDIRQRLVQGGADFADLARQFSSDGSAGKGGDLGWIYPGDTVPDFEKAMDALEPGQISEPVRSPFGLHLIQVIERRTDVASTDRLRAAARQALRERRADEAYQEWLRQLRDRTYVEYRGDERQQ